MKYNRVCANEKCDKKFETSFENKIYCSYKCKMSQEHRRYRRKNKEKLRKYAFSSKRKEYAREYYRKWAKKNKVRLRAKAREDYAKNREQYAEYARKYRLRNLDKLRAYWRSRYKKRKGGTNMENEIRINLGTLDESTKERLIEVLSQLGKQGHVKQEVPLETQIELKPLTKTAKVVQFLDAMKLREYAEIDEVMKTTGLDEKHLSFIIATNPLIELMEMGCVSISVCKLKSIPLEYVEKKYKQKERRRRMRIETPIKGTTKMIQLSMPTQNERTHEATTQKFECKTKRRSMKKAFAEMIEAFPQTVEIPLDYMMSRMEKDGFKRNSVYQTVSLAVKAGLIRRIRTGTYMKK